MVLCLFIKWEDIFVPHFQVHLVKIFRLKIVSKSLTTNKNNNWNKHTKMSYNVQKGMCSYLHNTKFTTVIIMLFKCIFNLYDILYKYSNNNKQ